MSTTVCWWRIVLSQTSIGPRVCTMGRDDGDATRPRTCSRKGMAEVGEEPGYVCLLRQVYRKAATVLNEVFGCYGCTYRARGLALSHRNLSTEPKSYPSTSRLIEALQD
ncbi:unnamed protein product [Ectocarpus sp. 4 AP-2014]